MKKAVAFIVLFLLNLSLAVADDAPLFTSNRPPAFYNVYSAPGRKSFFACHTWKFGSPQVIGQIAAFGRFADAYPVIHIDRERDLVLVLPSVLVEKRCDAPVHAQPTLDLARFLQRAAAAASCR